MDGNSTIGLSYKDANAPNIEIRFGNKDVQGASGPQGPQGPRGVSIESVNAISTSTEPGGYSEYQIVGTGGVVFNTFRVYNGVNGEGGGGSVDPSSITAGSGLVIEDNEISIIDGQVRGDQLVWNGSDWSVATPVTIQSTDGSITVGVTQNNDGSVTYNLSGQKIDLNTIQGRLSNEDGSIIIDDQNRISAKASIPSATYVRHSNQGMSTIGLELYHPYGGFVVAPADLFDDNYSIMTYDGTNVYKNTTIKVQVINDRNLGQPYWFNALNVSDTGVYEVSFSCVVATTYTLTDVSPYVMFNIFTSQGNSAMSEQIDDQYFFRYPLTLFGNLNNDLITKQGVAISNTQLVNIGDGNTCILPIMLVPSSDINTISITECCLTIKKVD